MIKKKVLIIGAGLAGSEAAYYLAEAGMQVILLEAKTLRPNPAQKMSTFAELVCTNSLKSIRLDTPHGMLKEEMKLLNSLILKVAEKWAVPAGDALAVDRERFSADITSILSQHPNITVIHREADNPLSLLEEFAASVCIIASGPLTSPSLEEWIKKEVSGDDFYFYDAIAPIIDAESIDFSRCYFKDRYKSEDNLQEGEIPHYLNAPMNKDEYESFIAALLAAEKVPAKNFEQAVFFESCLPIDVMAERGIDTARFSCMKPKGLERSGEKHAYAVVQMRRENLLGNAYNLVGFQTRLTYGEQKRIFRMIPGLEHAEFIHYGSVHRNSFIFAKNHLNIDMSWKKDPRFYFAGQMTGVEGYTESAASGLYVAWQVLRQQQEISARTWPVETAIGALINYLMTAERAMPMNINLGILPPVPLTKEMIKQNKTDALRKKLRKRLAQERGINALREFLSLPGLS